MENNDDTSTKQIAQIISRVDKWQTCTKNKNGIFLTINTISVTTLIYTQLIAQLHYLVSHCLHWQETHVESPGPITIILESQLLDVRSGRGKNCRMIPIVARENGDPLTYCEIVPDMCGRRTTRKCGQQMRGWGDGTPGQGREGAES